jgi:hypothetical protein
LALAISCEQWSRVGIAAAGGVGTALYAARAVYSAQDASPAYRGSNQQEDAIGGQPGQRNEVGAACLRLPAEQLVHFGVAGISPENRVLFP